MNEITIGREAYINQAIEDYYQYNPDTLMPLMMLALATQGKLAVRNDKKQGIVFASINIDEAKNYEWVILDSELKKRLNQMKAGGVSAINVVGVVRGELKEIYDTFDEYDRVTVVQEYHHRKGILVQHSENSASENAQRQYAILLLAEEFIAAPKDWLADNFLKLANDILVKSGIQPQRPRLQVAEALCTLLDYDGRGVVYNPFAGCAIAGAMIGAGKNFHADGDTNNKLLAIARMLCYGTGQRGYDIEERDSTKWLKDVKPDYVLSTFLGYVEGKSAFDICLGKCLKEFKKSGKFAGIAAPKEIFENQSYELKEALNKDWVETIVLLPFGEAAVLVNAAKSADRKKRIRFFDLTHPILQKLPIKEVISKEAYAKILKTSDVRKNGYLKSLVIPEIKLKEGFELITLGDLFEKIPRKVWKISNNPEEDRVLLTIDRTVLHYEYEFDYGLKKRPIVNLFAPAYKLDQDCLIVNCKGNLEPRWFHVENGMAFFQDGYAFKPKPLFWNKYDCYRDLIIECCKLYVTRQLHPYGMVEMVPEKITEDKVLQLKIDIPSRTPASSKKDEKEKNELESGYILNGEHTKYTIHKFLRHGCFGYTYTAAAHNLVTGEDKEVVLKEFYPGKYYRRVDKKAILKDFEHRDLVNPNINKFIEEAEIMNRLGLTHDSHIVPAYEHFRSEETNTYYYVMPFYNDGSLDDLHKSRFCFSEDMLIGHVVVPMCKALNIAHKNRYLHLDIKPENILLDEHGDAILTDFGVAKQYDDENNIIDRHGSTASSMFSAPELSGGVVHFGEQPDIFGLAATLYFLATDGEKPHQIMEFSEQDKDIRKNLDKYHFSKCFADAIVAGLQNSASLRPKNAQEFLNLFPGCENIKLQYNN